MEGLGKPVNQLVTPTSSASTRRCRNASTTSRAAKKLLAEAGYPNGFKVHVLLHQRPPARRPPGRHLDRADAGRHRHRCGGERAAGGGVLPGAHARRILDVDVGLGHADRRGALHPVVARALERQGKEDRVRSTCSATRTPRWTSCCRTRRSRWTSAKRRRFLEKANELVAEGSSAAADRCGRLGLGDAEGQGEDHRRAWTRTRSP